MRKLANFVARLSAKIQTRFQRSRPGSVMILVVTLLVLMALIGTAYITTARTDRFAALQHVINTQADLAVDGVKQMALASLGNGGLTSVTGEQRWDDVKTDTWLASRVPTTMIEACGVWNGTIQSYSQGEWVQFGGQFYVCKSASGVGASTLNQNPGGDPGNWLLDPLQTTEGHPIYDNTPCWPAISAPVSSGVPAVSLANPLSPVFFNASASRWLVQPTFVTINGKDYPAFRTFDPVALANGQNPFPVYMAASASGDGIADSWMWPVFAGDINGVNYYASVRIIDGNSAINLNTANSTYYDFNGAGTAGPTEAVFPSNIGLLELTPTFDHSTAALTSDANQTVGQDLGQDFRNFNNYRHTNVPGTGIDPISYQQNRPMGIAGGGTFPLTDAGAARNDFLYRSEAEALFMGLGRRIDVPAFSSNRSGLVRFGNFSWSDAGALSYGFDLVNPFTSPLSANPVNLSNAELLLYRSLVDDGRSGPYAEAPYKPSAVGGAPPNPGFVRPGGWFGSNYYYGDPNAGSVPTDIAYLNLPPIQRATFNRRALLVARNPTSNLMPLSPMLHLENLSASFPMAIYPPAAQPMGIAGAVNGTVVVGSPPRWPDPSVPLSSGIIPPIPKVSLNTADATLTLPVIETTQLGQFVPFHGPSLWFGFMNAMADSGNATYTNPGYNVPGGPAFPQFPQQFRSSLRDPNWPPAPPSPLTITTPISLNPNSGDPNFPGRPLQSIYPNNVTWFDQYSMVLLRSLIAAVNAKDMRDSDDDVSSEQANILVFVPQNGVSVPQVATVTVFGTERQPFITEVYANNDTSVQLPLIPDPTQPKTDPPGTFGMKPNPNAGASNPQGYVAVELFNPYDVPINLAGWTLGMLIRNPANYSSGMQVTPVTDSAGNIYQFPANTFIYPRSYMVVENFGTGGATYRPFTMYANQPSFNSSPTTQPATQPTDVPVISVTGLSSVLATPGELYLLRPRRADGVPLANVEADSTGKIIPGNFVPVDSFDFTGMHMATATPPRFQAWHYVRSNKFASNLLGPSNWQHVYPGRWDPTRVQQAPMTQPASASQAWLVAGTREEGVITTPNLVPNDTTMVSQGWDPTNVDQTQQYDPWLVYPPATQPTTQPSGGGGTTQPSVDPAAPIAMGAPDATSSSPSAIFPPIQLNNTGFAPGVNKNLTSNTAPVNLFPYGGFARVADVLQVPFIGSYTVRLNNGAILEMNPVNRDAALADCLMPAFAPYENIGKFTPLVAGEMAALPKYTVYPPGNAIFPPNVPIPTYDPYGWAARILDCFTTIQSPNDDYFPHADPTFDLTAASAGFSPAWKYNRWNPGFTGSPQYIGGPTPIPIANTLKGSANLGTEDTAPVEGLININTAPWRVLAAVPWKSPSGGATLQQLAAINADFATQIIQYRQTWGPFKSLLDLNRVPISAAAPGTFFQSMNGPPGGADFTYTEGDFTPNFAGADGLVNDSKQRYQAITRVSNLLTTHSDTYTVYIYLQGWRGIGTPNPELVVQRRAAFIADRSGITSSGGTPVVHAVSTTN